MYHGRVRSGCASHLARAAPALLVIVGLVSSARASEASIALEKARRALRVPSYAEAIELAERALEEPDLPANERADAYEILGTALVAKGATERAEAAFGKMLELDPNRQIASSVSPKIRELIGRAKEKRRRAPRIEALSATISRGLLSFSLEIDDPDDQARSAELWARTRGEGFAPVTMSPSDRGFTATIAASHANRIEYFAVVRSEDGSEIARAGSAASPSVVMVEERTPPPAHVELPSLPVEPVRPVIAEEHTIFQRWWFWALVGVAVVGSAGAYALLRGPGDPEPIGNLPPIRLD
jgi:hypothetical protein